VSAPNDFGGLNSEQWQELCDCASRLEQTLLGGATAVDLRRFLPPPEAPHRRVVFFELIETELEARYRDGRGVPLEEFLKRYPELGGRDDVPAEVVYEEYRVSRLHGDRPELDVYRARFPHQFERLEELLRLHPVPEPATLSEPPPGNRTRGSPTDVSPSAPQPLGTAPDTERPARARTRGHDIPRPHGTPAALDATDLVLSGGQGYQKLERLGRGEFGEVWRALAPGGVEVAVKIILRTVDHEASQRELKALEEIRKLRHPFLLQTHQYQAERDHLVIVMEVADGSLSDRFKECKAKGMAGIPVEELVTYFAQAAEALDYLHSQRVSHRDIKPQNLLMLRGYAKVADFGLARWQDQAVDNATVVCGTPHFMAPEVWRQQVSKHSDQYSLASTYVEMRLGRHLFPGKNNFEVAEHHLRSEPNLDPLPAAEQTVLRRALAKEPDRRYPSCVEFATALREAVTPKKVEPPRRSIWPVLALLAPLALALPAVLVALHFLSQEPVVQPKPWCPEGWEAETGAEVIKDPKTQRDYHSRLVREVGRQRVVMIAIPPTNSSDPPLFYIMENKVWNDLFAAFMADPESGRLFTKYRLRSAGLELVLGEWEKGARAPGAKPPILSLGVGDGRGSMPVFSVTVTEAHCFAEWLGGMAGRLPQRVQWLKAAGLGEDTRPDTPFVDTAPGIAVNLGKTGPWPVTQGDRDLSIRGCRQMAGNGREWTRTMHTAEGNEKEEEFPLQIINRGHPVLVCGQSYAALKPLTFEKMVDLDDKDCTKNDPEISFRVVLEP
jgi:serine/threonine protein kinase